MEDDEYSTLSELLYPLSNQLRTYHEDIAIVLFSKHVFHLRVGTNRIRPCELLAVANDSDKGSKRNEKI